MYIPPAFKESDLTTIHAMMRSIGLASLVTSSQSRSADDRAGVAAGLADSGEHEVARLISS